MNIAPLRKKDYKKVIGYAIIGMHFDWYMSSRIILNAYGRYFLYMELNRATQIITAYEGDTLVGVLLAEMQGERPVQRSFIRSLYVKVFDVLQHIVARGAVVDYEEANKRMLAAYQSRIRTDGELVLLAADPGSKGKGVGTMLLEELRRRESGKRIYLFTDSGCTYQFYEHRGFDRIAEEHVELDFEDNHVPLDCYLYSRQL